MSHWKRFLRWLGMFHTVVLSSPRMTNLQIHIERGMGGIDVYNAEFDYDTGYYKLGQIVPIYESCYGWPVVFNGMVVRIVQQFHLVRAVDHIVVEEATDWMKKRYNV